MMRLFWKIRKRLFTTRRQQRNAKKGAGQAPFLYTLNATFFATRNATLQTKNNNKTLNLCGLSLFYTMWKYGGKRWKIQRTYKEV